MSVPFYMILNTLPLRVDMLVIKKKNDGKILAFRNMIKEGMPRELAQKCAELSDQLAEQVLAEM